MHTPESISAEVAYRRQLAQQNWPIPGRSVRRRRRAEHDEGGDPAPDALRAAFVELFRLLRYRLRQPADNGSAPRATAITLRLAPDEESALAGMACAAGISRDEAALRAIRQAAGRSGHSASNSL